MIMFIFIYIYIHQNKSLYTIIILIIVDIEYALIIFDNINDFSWTVWRSYEDFSKVYKNLSHAFPDHKVILINICVSIL